MMAITGLASRVEASDGMRGDRCEVGVDDFIAEDFYFFCRILDVRGTIDGDLLGIASEVIIQDTAVITGDVWVGGGKVIVAGTIGDDIHFAGLNLEIDDSAQFLDPRIDVASLALNTDIKTGAAIPGDLLVYGYQASVSGYVGGDIDFLGESLRVEGHVEGRVDAQVGDSRRSNNLPGLPFYDVSFRDPGLEVGPDAYIGGDLAYQTARGALIPIGVVQGRVIFNQTLAQPDITKVEQADAAAEILVDYITRSFRDVLTLVIIGAVGLRLVPGLVREPALHVRRRMITAIGWGLVTFTMSFPVAIVVLVVTLLIVGLLLLINLSALSIMVGVGLLLVDATFLAGLAFLVFFMGRVVVSYVIGQLIYRYVLKIMDPGTFRMWLTKLALGTVVYALLTNIPVPWVGLTLELITALAGVGAVIMYAREVWDRSRLPSARSLPSIVQQVRLMPAPADHQPLLVPDDHRPVGLENLPEGFRGFEDW